MPVYAPFPCEQTDRSAAKIICAFTKSSGKQLFDNTDVALQCLKAKYYSSNNPEGKLAVNGVKGDLISVLWSKRNTRTKQQAMARRDRFSTDICSSNPRYLKIKHLALWARFQRGLCRQAGAQQRWHVPPPALGWRPVAGRRSRAHRSAAPMFPTCVPAVLSFKHPRVERAMAV